MADIQESALSVYLAVYSIEIDLPIRVCLSKKIMIFITSYPYVSSRHIKVFDFFKKKDDLVFILPKVWKMKKGKVVLKPVSRPDLKIIPTPAHFFHSRHFIIRGLMKGWMPATGKLLRKLAKPGDVLYTAMEPHLLVTLLNGLLAKKLGLKHVFFTWQNVSYPKRLSGAKLKLTEWLLRKNISLSMGGICGNSKALEVLSPYLPSDFRTVVIPISGVETEKFKPGIASNFRQENHLDGKIILIFIGAFDERKGIATLLDAFKASLTQEPRLHLVMIGAGHLEKKIREYVGKNLLGSSVYLFPWQDNDKLPGILNGSDVFLYPSEPFGGWEEQFGYSIAEASACGLPVISTTTGSIPDKVVSGETGFLIEPGNREELKKAILTLAGDDRLRKKMGENGRRLIVEKFSHEIVAQKMENFLRSL